MSGHRSWNEIKHKSHDDDPADCDNYTLDDLLSNMLDEDRMEFPRDYCLDEPIDDLQYRDEVVLKLIDALQEYMSFSTTRDLLKLIVDNL